jgi:hypothetical protein
VLSLDAVEPVPHRGDQVHRLRAHPQGLCDLVGVDALLEQPRGLQPHILSAGPALSSQPATIRIPHRTGLNPAVPPATQGAPTGDQSETSTFQAL